MAGLSHQTSGMVALADAKTEAGINRQRRNIGFMIETPALYPNLSVMENLYLVQMQYLGKKDVESAKKALELTGLPEQGRKKTKHLSLGMKQRLALTMTMGISVAGSILGVVFTNKAYSSAPIPDKSLLRLFPTVQIPMIYGKAFSSHDYPIALIFSIFLIMVTLLVGSVIFNKAEL